MKKISLFILFSLISSYQINIGTDDICKKPKKIKKKSPKKETVFFNYANEDIGNIINQLAAIKRINVIFPQPPNKLQGKVNFVKPDEITIDEAWNILITILNQAGYTISQQADGFYKIFKNEIATREPLPFFVNDINNIPNSDQRIRFIYFFEKISISEQGSPSYNNIEQILRDMLPPENEGSTYILDPSTNSVTLVGQASAISGIIGIIKQLDFIGFPETIEIVPLEHTKSDFIAKIINQLIPGQQESFRYGPFSGKTKTGGNYFSELTKIVPIDRTNSIAIMGPPDSVDRIKDFIVTYLDQPIESEKSVIHVKPLQYLDADTLAPVIQDLVKARSQAAQADAGNSEKDTLSNAIIVAEKLVQAPTITPTINPSNQNVANPAPTNTAPLVGGNRLIIAARSQDWQSINRLIDEIDQPQLQVALEVLVVDLTIDDGFLIGGQIRNPLNGKQPNGVNAQASHLDTNNNANPPTDSPGPWMNFKDGSTTDYTKQGLASDLLKMTNNPPYTDSGSLINIANLATAGSTILSFKNGNGIAAILQVLDTYNSTSILSQPFVIAKNNQQANLSIAREQRYFLGVEQQSTGGPIIQKRDVLRADLTVNILPRINKSSDINLEILVNVNDFNNVDTGNITTRQVRTNSNLKNKEVLVIGGLSKTNTVDTVTETPILSKIPIIGNFFKRKEQRVTKANLMIFISPTIIYPRLQGGLDLFTQNKVNLVKEQVLESEIDILGTNFEKLRDPVTRYFFVPLGKSVNSAIDYFAEQKAYKEGSEQVEVAKEIQTAPGSTTAFGAEITKEDSSKYDEIKELAAKDKNPLLDR